MQSEAFDCKRNYQEQTQEKDTEKCEATDSTCDAATNAQSEIGIKRMKTESQREQEDESMEWKPTETDRNKADVKQSHPIIHNTLLSQLKMAAGSNQSTSSSHNNPVPVPVLGPFSMSLLPSISSLNFATSLALAKTYNNISEHTVKSSCPSLSNREPQVTTAKAQELSPNLGSIHLNTETLSTWLLCKSSKLSFTCRFLLIICVHSIIKSWSINSVLTLHSLVCIEYSNTTFLWRIFGRNIIK